MTAEYQLGAGGSARAPRTAVLAGVAAVYLLAGKLALALAPAHAPFAAWPCAGIALAACLLFGYGVWPAIFAASFLVSFPSAGPALLCLAIAAGSTVEALVAAWLVQRFAGGRYPLGSARHILKFALLAGVCGAAIGATAGVASFRLAAGAAASLARATWITWWLGDAAGSLLIAPLILVWVFDPHLHWRRAQLLEVASLLACLVAAGLVVFNGLFASFSRDYPLEYLCLPLLLWAAVRFGQREAASATFVLATLAVAGTRRGFGPFVVGGRAESLPLLLAFIAVSAVMTLAVAVLFAERRRSEEQAQALAFRDPLTGLGNYRRLHDALDAELRRSDRTGRSFAFLLFDLDGLKQINDAYGHPVGSRALCRLADVLRMHSRSIDTAARYGGDEFALIMPEADAGIAQQVGRRIRDRLANDGQFPAVTVSVGHSVWPRDGRSFEALVQAADHNLYAMKLAVHAGAEAAHSGGERR